MHAGTLIHGRFAVLAHHGHLRVRVHALRPQVFLDSIRRIQTDSIILILKLTFRTLTGCHLDTILLHLLICRNRNSIMCKMDVDFRNDCWLLVNRNILIIVKHALFAVGLAVLNGTKRLRENSAILELVLSLHLELLSIRRIYVAIVQGTKMSVWAGSRRKTLKLLIISFDDLVTLNLSSGIDQLFNFECLHSKLFVLLFKELFLFLNLQIKFLDAFVEHFLLHSQQFLILICSFRKQFFLLLQFA